MSQLTNLAEIDLLPIPGKTYFNTDREWREEFIYFLMVDRFHDNDNRNPTPGSARTFGVYINGDTFYGGTIKGITNHLDYIAGLGCTAIWLSPVFENTDTGYHGYHIRNYLNIDPHFGTKQDLVDLVQAAHSFIKDGKPYPIRIILDVVINHSADTWYYKGRSQGGGPAYSGQPFEFGDWRSADYPIPLELRNAQLYHKKGNIQQWDVSPENLEGDLIDLKDYNNEDTADGSALLNILIKSHCYWIKEADIDGFRVDAVKHFYPLACARFSSAVREYAYSLGKRNFFLFGELANSDDEIYQRYLGPNTSDHDQGKTVFYGINSLLDFRLAKGVDNDPLKGPLRSVITGRADPASLFSRLASQENQSLNRGELGRYLVSFVDNHDIFWQSGRIASEGNDEQIIAAIGFILCALGTPCIYYGTEQGFAGWGSDYGIREAMFDKGIPGKNLLNTDCFIYKAIGAIASIVKQYPSLRFGRMYYREISGDGIHFNLPYGYTYTLAFSRMLYGQEILVAYNVSSFPRTDYVIVDRAYHQPGDILHFLYGASGNVVVQTDGTANFVQLKLAPHQFVILA